MGRNTARRNVAPATLYGNCYIRRRTSLWGAPASAEWTRRSAPLLPADRRAEALQDRADRRGDRRPVRAAADQDPDRVVDAVVGHDQRSRVPEGAEALAGEDLAHEQGGARRKRDLHLEVDRLDRPAGELGGAADLEDGRAQRRLGRLARRRSVERGERGAAWVAIDRFGDRGVEAIGRVTVVGHRLEV